MSDYRKVKCVPCGYEWVARAKKPECKKCGSVRNNPIAEFSAQPQEHRIVSGMAKPIKPMKDEQPKERGFFDGLLDDL